MMLSTDPGRRDVEIAGMKPLEVRMYDLAWKHLKEHLGFTGLCNLWIQLSPNCTLKNIKVVFNRLIEYSYFNADPYYVFAESDEIINDFIPNIYMKRGFDHV